MKLWSYVPIQDLVLRYELPNIIPLDVHSILASAFGPVSRKF